MSVPIWRECSPRVGLIGESEREGEGEREREREREGEGEREREREEMINHFCYFFQMQAQAELGFPQWSEATNHTITLTRKPVTGKRMSLTPPLPAPSPLHNHIMHYHASVIS